MQANGPNAPEHPLEAGLARVRRLRLDGAHEAALGMLVELEHRFSVSGLLWQERAQCQRAYGDMPAAAASYRRAVQLNDALPECWQALIELHRAAGQAGEAAHAAACVAKLQSLPPQLLQSSCLLNEGEVDEADRLVRDYLRREGIHVDGLRLLAQIAVKREIFDDAELLLEKVLELAPDYHDARHELGAVLLERRRYYPALVQARHLLRVDPRPPSWRLLYAKACDGLGEFDEALRVYREVRDEMPGDASIDLMIAHVLRNRGTAAEAIAGFRDAAGRDGLTGAAFLALANMKTYRFTDEEISRMQQAEAAAPPEDAERYRLCFALGKAFEDRRQFEESFRYYERGNALKRAQLSYNPELVERFLRAQMSVCTADLLAARSRWGCPRPGPIFIVGLPRSGSTLVEQILASHSQIDGTQELAEIPRLVKQFRSRRPDEPLRYPHILSELTAEELRRMGEIYFEETQPYRRGAPFFLDKMPSNFRDVGFIHLILPHARIIDARRDAMACCFGNFKQVFIKGQDFSYDQGELGRYYRRYIELMEHWDRVLPGKVLHVRYEDVVADLAGSVRRILDFCGLPFEQACLEFYKTERSVRTVSSEQVRRPIYREGLEQWRNYERWLGPLKSALGLVS